MAHHFAICYEGITFFLISLWFTASFSTSAPLYWFRKKKKRNHSRFRYWLSETLTLVAGKATTFKSRIIASEKDACYTIAINSGGQSVI